MFYRTKCGKTNNVFLDNGIKSSPLLFVMVLPIHTLGNHCAQELQIQAAYPYVQIAMCLPVAAAVEGSSTFNQIACCLDRGKYLTDLVHIR